MSVWIPLLPADVAGTLEMVSLSAGAVVIVTIVSVAHFNTKINY